MSTNYLQITPQSYQGTPIGLPTKLCVPATQPPQAVQATLEWAVYGASTINDEISVTLDLTLGVKTALDAIRSIYIDNTQSAVSINVVFPDTNFVAAMAPYTAGWVPVITNDLKAYVIGRGFVDGNIPQTRVYFTNVFMPGMIDPEVSKFFPQHLASPEILVGQNPQASITPGFNVPALGDQVAQYNQVYTTAGPSNTITNNIFGTPKASGYIVLTSLQFRVNYLGSSASIVIDSILEGVVAGVLLSQRLQTAANTIVVNGQVYQNNGMQIRIPATENWRFRSSINDNIVANSNGVMTVMWTYQPN